VVSEWGEVLWRGRILIVVRGGGTWGGLGVEVVVREVEVSGWTPLRNNDISARVAC
jgi:hypothetical protein